MSENFANMMVNGDRIFPALLADIEAATRSVHISMFLFFRDPIGEELAALLEKKVAEGVTVRVLLNVEKTAMGDPFSTGEHEMMKHDPNIDYDPTNVKPLCARMTKAGVLVQDTNIDYDLDIPGIAPRLRSVAEQIRKGISIDDMHVDHRKVVVIDGHVGWCGGANVGAQYMFHVPFDPQRDAREEGDERKKAKLPEPWWKWHDSLTRFEGPIVTRLESTFQDRWILDGGAAYESATARAAAAPSSTTPRGMAIHHAHLYCNAPSDEPNEIRNLYLRNIRSAKHSIFIENPYLYHDAIPEALCAAKSERPDLRVVLVVPDGRHNDNSFGQDAQEHHYAQYLQCGVEVYEYQNHFNHLKMAVFDEHLSIHGSTNLNYRSLEDDKDFELVVFVDDEPLGRWILEHVRDVDIANGRRITEADLSNGLRGLRRRIRDPRTLAMLAKRVL